MCLCVCVCGVSSLRLLLFTTESLATLKRGFQVMLMLPPTRRSKGAGPLRFLLSPFFRYFGQAMLLFCDALMIYRMDNDRAFHLTVSIMCPIFQLGVFAITWNCDSALKDSRNGLINIPISRPQLLRSAQTAIAVVNIVVVLMMVVLFVVWTPLNQAAEGTDLFNLASLHRVWLTNVLKMYENMTFIAFYSLGLVCLGFIWCGITAAYANNAFIVWSRLRDCRDLVKALKTRASAVVDANAASSYSSDNVEASIGDADDEVFRCAVRDLVDAVNDSLAARSSMASMIRLGFISAMFDLMLLILFLIFSLLIVKCSSMCKTYGTESYDKSVLAGTLPCVYTRENAFLVRGILDVILLICVQNGVQFPALGVHLDHGCFDAFPCLAFASGVSEHRSR